jgi:hypothetical protein
MEEAQLKPWERKVGAHALWFEPPDLLGMRPSGPMSSDEAAELLEELTELARLVPHALGLMDISGLGQLSSEARLVALKWTRPPNTETAVYGASFRHRVMLELLSKAARLFARDFSAMNFFETEREARAFLEERRRALASARG